MDNNDQDQKLIINGQEYSPDEAQNLIDYGKRTKEAEQKYNTSFDKVWPEYSRSQTRLKELESELEQTRTQLTNTKAQENKGYSSSNGDENLSDSQKEAARRLGVVFNDDLEDKYLSKDKFNDLFQSALSQHQAQQDGIQQVLKQAGELEEKINGGDGRPRFRKDIVMPYAATNGFGDLGDAYEQMYKDDLESWKTAQVEASKKPSLKTLRSGGAKTPPTVKVNRDNLNDLITEAMYGSDE